MFLHSTARLKDGRLSRADSRKAAKDLNRRKQRKFEQKEAKVAKVRHLPSEKLFFRHGHSPALNTARFQDAHSTSDRNIARARLCANFLGCSYGRGSDAITRNSVPAGTSFASFVTFCSKFPLRFLLCMGMPCGCGFAALCSSMRSQTRL